MAYEEKVPSIDHGCDEVDNHTTFDSTKNVATPSLPPAYDSPERNGTKCTCHAKLIRLDETEVYIRESSFLLLKKLTHTKKTPNKGRLHFLRIGSNKGLFLKSPICHYFESSTN